MTTTATRVQASPEGVAEYTAYLASRSQLGRYALALGACQAAIHHVAATPHDCPDGYCAVCFYLTSALSILTAVDQLDEQEV